MPAHQEKGKGADRSGPGSSAPEQVPPPSVPIATATGARLTRAGVRKSQNSGWSTALAGIFRSRAAATIRRSWAASPVAAKTSVAPLHLARLEMPLYELDGIGGQERGKIRFRLIRVGNDRRLRVQQQPNPGKAPRRHCRKPPRTLRNAEEGRKDGQCARSYAWI